jgi:hypothetical protein
VGVSCDRKGDAHARIKHATLILSRHDNDASKTTAERLLVWLIKKV